MTNATAPVPRRRRRPTRIKAVADGQGMVASERYYSRAIGRALDVLECFSDDQTALNLKEIGQLTHLPESSLFRVLVTLEGRGYLRQKTPTVLTTLRQR